MQLDLNEEYEIIMPRKNAQGNYVMPIQAAYTNKLFTCFEHLPVQYQVYIDTDKAINFQPQPYTLKWKIRNALFFIRYELLPALQEAKQRCDGLCRPVEK